jgi:hypothetical protein
MAFDLEPYTCQNDGDANAADLTNSSSTKLTFDNVIDPRKLQSDPEAMSLTSSDQQLHMCCSIRGGGQ